MYCRTFEQSPDIDIRFPAELSAHHYSSEIAGTDSACIGVSDGPTIISYSI